MVMFVTQEFPNSAPRWERFTDKPFRAAVIGLGRQATEDHLPGIMNSSMAQLVAICDLDEERLQSVGAGLDVPRFRDHRALLEHIRPDFVVVATPHDQYRQIIEDACRCRVHVLKEKPFARNLEEARYIRKLCEEYGITLMTTLQRRFNPIYTSFFQLIDQIGTPFFLDIRYTMFVEAPHEGWRGLRTRAGGGCIIDMGYHMIDLLIWYFGLPSTLHAEISTNAISHANYDAEDTASIVFTYNYGPHGVMVLSRYYPPKTELLRVIGTKGILEIERGSIKRLLNNGQVVEHLTREHAWPAAAATQIDYFCRVVHGERENLGSPEHHLQHAAFIEACYQSATEGRFIDPRRLMGGQYA